MIWIGAMALTACMFVSPNNGDGGLPAVDGHAFFNLPEFCVCCHEEGGPEVQVEPHGFTVEITEMCMRCHVPSDIGTSHPVDVVAEERYPDMEVPDYMPVDAEGRITCGTCHNPHLPGHSTERFSLGQVPTGTREVDGREVEFFRTYRLRAHAPGAGNDPTCEACHQEYFADRAQ
jgi:hypothetical protein